MVSLRDSTATPQRFEPPRRRWFRARISQRQLARMCHNVGSSLHAGVDVRRVWQNEALRGSPRHREQMAMIRDRVSAGEGLTDAMRATDGYFPPIVCEMVDVGERTGRVEKIFFRLAEHYDQMVSLRRAVLWGLAWPMFELIVGLLVIGLFILIQGAVWNGPGPPPMTFFGLYGTRGLAIYSGTLASIAALIMLVVFAVRHGWISLDPLLRILIRVPGIGTGLQTMAISRLTWSLALSTDSDLDARRAAELALRTTHNSYYTDHIEGIKRSIRAGSDLHSAFRHTGVFPADFLDTLETGEVSGRISESMQVLAKEYEDRARNYYRVLAVAMGIAVVLVVFGLIIAMIFQLAMQYLNMWHDALEI